MPYLTYYASEIGAHGIRRVMRNCIKERWTIKFILIIGRHQIISGDCVPKAASNPDYFYDAKVKEMLFPVKNIFKLDIKI